VRPSASCPHGCLSRAQPSEPDLDSFISPIAGVVSGLTVSAGPEAGLFHARACFVQPLTPAPPPQPPEFAYGCGTTGQFARNSAVAEALERYSCTWRGSEQVVRARLSELDAIPPEHILLFSESQYRNRDAWNALHGEMHSIPEPFDPSREIDWVLGEPLGTGEPKYLPAECVYFLYPPSGPAYCQADSNGCAAGRTPSQAALRALLECIERDALAIWWYNRLPRPAVAPAAAADPRLQPIVDSLAQRGRRFWFLDIATDLQVPCYVAVSARPDGSELLFGAAADLCERDAMFRAASELSQVWFWSTHSQPHPEFASWLGTATLTSDPYFLPCGEKAPGFTARLPAGEALIRCIAGLQAAGIHPLCVDLTRPEIGLSVKRVIAPGLRHFWGRFAPGRLYDVPVRQGWLARPLPEEALNPVPCML